MAGASVWNDSGDFMDYSEVVLETANSENSDTLTASEVGYCQHRPMLGNKSPAKTDISDNSATLTASETGDCQPRPPINFSPPLLPIIDEPPVENLVVFGPPNDPRIPLWQELNVRVIID